MNMERPATAIYQRLRDAWASAGASVNDGATSDAIARLESKRNIRLPAEFRDYLAVANGMEDSSMDDGLISFHSLDVIDREWIRYESESPDCVNIPFANWSLDAHWYGLRASRDGDEMGVWFLDGTHSWRLAPSFREFVEMYLLDPTGSLSSL